MYISVPVPITICRLVQNSLSRYKCGICCRAWKPNTGNMKYEPGTSKENTGPIENKTIRILGSVLTFSTCSVVKSPPYLSLAKSSLDGM